MTPATPDRIPFAAAFRYWLKLGCISFGGPAGQIAMMHDELVEKRRWISEGRFLHALNYCMVLPGPEAQQLATYIGWLMHGPWGGIMAGALFVLPSLVLLVALSWIYMAFGHLAIVAGVLYGIKPAVTAIVLSAAWRIGSRTLRNAWLWAIAIAAFLAITVFNVPFPWIIFTAGVIGYVGGQVSPRHFSTGGAHGAARRSAGRAIIDDDTPAPAWAAFSAGRLARLVAGGVLICVVALGLLAAVHGRESTLAQMGWFFTKAALLTFGGAYAVLPYVYQGAVEQFQWLTGPQMIDGLALGETTPGPLIMVVAYVGFVGAWTKAVLGPDALFLAGTAGAMVATFFTFLPSFIFILAGGPLVERTHGALKFTAPLTGITAAVVGVIVNLAVFFAWHVLWPRGAGASAGEMFANLDWLAAAIGVAAFAALVRWKVDVLKVIVACAAVGLVVTFAGVRG